MTFIFTAGIRRMGEGNVFSLFTREGRGGTPGQDKVPPPSLPPSQDRVTPLSPDWDRGTPSSPFRPSSSWPGQKYLPSHPSSPLGQDTGTPPPSQPHPSQDQDGCAVRVVCLLRSRSRAFLSNVVCHFKL